MPHHSYIIKSVNILYDQAKTARLSE